MRAYEFVLPQARPEQACLCENLEWVLAKELGGFTRLDGVGGWRGPRGQVVLESVSLYRVALAWRDIVRGAESRLFEIAMQAARDAGEQALYYGTPGRPAIYPTGR